MPNTKQQLDPLLVMSLGGMLGGLAGFGIWMASDAFVFLPVCLAVGLITGIAMVEARKRR